MENITCPGFMAGGLSAGIKKKREKDLGLIYSEKPANVAGLFTRNRVQAAPVVLDRQRIGSGVAQAVIVNSGNANCCTGAQGEKDAAVMTQKTATALGIPDTHVLVSSTGVIGQTMPMRKIEQAIPELAGAIEPEGFPAFARAIMTTDRVPKLVVRKGSSHGNTFTLLATAKGAGMIRPDMATMLCFVCTDVQSDAGTLNPILSSAVERSFNRITIDGDMSTNDTVLLLANGVSGISINDGPGRKIFQEILDEMLMDLARQLVKDGEGVTKVVDILVKGAPSDVEARDVADTVANSNLVKTAFFGEDANWGRILGAAGRSGVPVEPDRIDLFFDDVQMVKEGMGCGDKAEAKASQVLKKDAFSVTLDLNLGHGTASSLTCDFSVEYVRINADYRS